MTIIFWTKYYWKWVDIINCKMIYRWLFKVKMNLITQKVKVYSTFTRKQKVRYWKSFVYFYQRKYVGWEQYSGYYLQALPISLSIMGQLFIAFHYPVTAPVNTKAKEINNCRQPRYLLLSNENVPDCLVKSAINLKTEIIYFIEIFSSDIDSNIFVQKLQEFIKHPS